MKNIIVTLCLLSIFISSTHAINLSLSENAWSLKQPAGEYAKNWRFTEMSDDGQTIVVAHNGNQLFLSTDAGESWAEVNPNPSSTKRNYKCCAMSGDGSRILVAKSTGRIYLSGDRGVNWIELQPFGSANKAWASLAMNKDGGTVLAAKSGLLDGQLTMSKDGGGTWNEIYPAGNRKENWNAVAVSDDGLTMIAAMYEGSVYTSTNGGTSWNKSSIANDYGWNKAAISADGNKMFMCSEGRLYLSTNKGSSWKELKLAGDDSYNWRVAAMSNDGSKLIAGISDDQENGRVYYSSDGGSAWNETQPLGNELANWEAGSMSKNGASVIVGARSGHIYMTGSMFATAIKTVDQARGVKIYPNPATDVIIIDSETASELCDIEVYNSLGVRVSNVQQITEKQIQINELNSGVYFLNLHFANNTTKVVRVVKR